MHVTTASPFPARPVRPPSEKPRAYSSFAARTSSKPPTSGKLTAEGLLERRERFRADVAVHGQRVRALEALDGELRRGAEVPVRLSLQEMKGLELLLEELHLGAFVAFCQLLRRRGQCGRGRGRP